MVLPMPWDTKILKLGQLITIRWPLNVQVKGRDHQYSKKLSCFKKLLQVPLPSLQQPLPWSVSSHQHRWKKKDDFKRPLWKLKNSCDSVYCSGLELSLQYLRGMPICVISSLQEEDEALGSGRGLTCLTFLKCKTINDSTCVIVWLSTEIRWVKHSVPHLTFTKWFVNKSLLLDVQGYHYHLYWITLNRVSTFLEYILVFAYYLKYKETSILISFPPLFLIMQRSRTLFCYWCCWCLYIF